MTVMNRDIAAAAPHTLQREPLQVRWSCTITKWNDRFGLLAASQRHGTVELVIALTSDANDVSACSLTAWLALGERRRTVLPRSAARCMMLSDGELLHTDAWLDSDPTQRMLSLTRRGDQLVFAQSPLLSETGFTGGSYDPPMLIALESHYTQAIA